ncbi:cytochrome c oxidase subunit II [Streptomyces sp. Li-HN-5-11]|uniref:cytochrome c oxidase subunit II n=1 Tax=Streptomyces sp. Li-HN-5-11 TaxID=3075432 RepID=UPI0028AA8639|nr:cytochrome c oxidase subunit II [Streptomyces sp. Li-HN-5-11]WNM32584.1 cytochrome c oxidase subunit II [Streptomyces sp. Li-HN-5-11]WOP38670.1 cytochrome c oxidase subunit II [Streptomyces sp. Li-HN-5-13]
MNQRHVFGEVFTLETAIASFVFVAVLALLAIAVIRRRAGAGREPSRRAERNRLESYYLGALAAIAVFLVVYTALANHREYQTKADQPTARVDVTAFQWCWKFSYPGSAAQRAVSVQGTCRNNRFPTLVVPTGTTIKIRVTSKDVIHSMWIPALRYKMDAFPNHENTFSLTFDRAGRWRGRCAEFCGERHKAMDFWVKAVSPDEYRKWLAKQAAGSATGAAV